MNVGNQPHEEKNGSAQLMTRLLDRKDRVYKGTRRAPGSTGTKELQPFASV